MVTAILDFQKPDFWAMGFLGLSIFQIWRNNVERRRNYEIEIQDNGRPPSWICVNQISEQWVPLVWRLSTWGQLKFGAKTLIDAEIMGQSRNPRWRPSAILYFQKSDFWALGPIGLPIFYHCTKFGAKMLIDDEIMAENRNPRWRPSAILDLSHHHIGPPTKSIH